MRKISIIGICLLVTACGGTTVPVTPKWPDAPAHLLQPPPELQPLPTGKKVEMSDLLENANRNYSKYRDLARHIQQWQEWYNQQKTIWETVK
jgi:hypothetical protein